jgi:hypothetical protein
MEQVRSRVAVEEAVKSIGGHRPPTTRLRRCPPIAILAVLVTGLALPAPLAFAHGNQFLCARVTIGNDGLVALELTADHGDNPNIADAAQARQVLRECLQIGIGDQRLPLEHFAPLHFTERDQYSADSPVPPAIDPGPHRLVVASWQARLPGQQIVFVAKERTPLDVVLWRAGDVPGAGQSHSRWVLLIAGDSSPHFAATAPSSSGAIATQIMIMLLVFPLLVLFVRTLTHRRLAVPRMAD